ncbi:MAG TPA: ABC transporter ATP-binding protein [Candidatus Hydrothermia bacterium]|nr:ABC transporter ATP-binding protein [Candidatus Hydrothermia bacterium]MDD5573323.1 ABC transporter ATP-binding protein [Candidatus Hydrothermia bacterium]HOK23533.1 ABC transporter ATP-binding protein [Candidatus Hydrothermia bacterium]HOL24238.1 ABC transporter ATP-binding protein [Candidatus Hydrothermia bacterium]HPO79191.1 ABC transporter ATP-binding protein [Candidatus Hydrothermia bacterium]
MSNSQEEHTKTTGKFIDRKVLRRTLQFVKPFRKLVVLAFIFLMITATIQILMPIINRRAIDFYILPSYIELAKPELIKEFQLEPYVVQLVDGKTLIKRPALPREISAELERQNAFLDINYYITKKTIPGKETLFVETVDGKFAIEQSKINIFTKPQLLDLRGEDLAKVSRLAITLAVILLFSFVFSFLQGYTLQYVTQKVMYNMRMTISDHLLNLPLSYFDRNPTGRLVTRATNDVSALSEMLGSVLVYLIKDAVVIVGVVIIMLRMNVKLTLLVLSISPILLAVTIIFRIKVREAFRKVRAKLSQLNAFVQESISGIRVIQIFNLENLIKGKFRAQNKELYDANIQQLYVSATFRPIIDFLRAVSVALIIWIGGGEVIRNMLTFGSLIAFLSYIDMLFQPIVEFSEKYNIMQSAMAAGDRIFELLDEPVEPKGKGLKKEIAGKVEFRNVWFSYNSNNWVLKDISFIVNPGETLAIVGPTGAGKTSLISTIFGFYPYQKGQILIDDIPIEEYDLDHLRSQMGLVLQDVFVFSGELKKNIALFNEKISQKEIEEAARHVYAHTFIERLGNGYDTALGERGASLSVGERQLLSFARALAFNPKILVLDEATANVDSYTERLIQQAIKRVLKGRTSIVIAHRLSTIKDANKIIVIYDGKIIEEGTHDSLIQKKGMYYHLYMMQFARANAWNT